MYMTLLLSVLVIICVEFITDYNIGCTFVY